MLNLFLFLYAPVTKSAIEVLVCITPQVATDAGDSEPCSGPECVPVLALDPATGPSAGNGSIATRPSGSGSSSVPILTFHKSRRGGIMETRPPSRRCAGTSTGMMKVRHY